MRRLKRGGRRREAHLFPSLRSEVRNAYNPRSSSGKKPGQAHLDSARVVGGRSLKNLLSFGGTQPALPTFPRILHPFALRSRVAAVQALGAKKSQREKGEI